jgi:hypothetical protein
MSPRPLQSRLAVAALAVLLTTGCAVEVVPPLEDDQLGLHFGDGYLATMFGPTLVDIWAGGQVVGDPVVLTPGAPMGITAAFHDAGANMIMGLSEYELVMEPAAPLVAFKRTGPFEGTLTGLSPGQTLLRVGLRNTQRQLEDFGPFPVPVTVR